MFQKISKIMFLGGKSYLVFILFATLLSIFSYMLSSNIILSVNDYLKSQIKPLLGGDIVLYADDDIIDADFRGKYGSDFRIAETIETTTTIFDAEKNPSLVELVYHDENYPIYDTFSYDIINLEGSIVVSQEIYDRFGSDIEILGKDFSVLGIISEIPTGSISLFSNFEKIYLPLWAFDGTLSSANSRLDYETYLQFLWEYDQTLAASLKDEFNNTEIRVRTLDDRNETIGDITDRLSLFINFFNLLVFILTFFVVILSLETFYKKLKNTIGLLSILWLKKTRIFLYSIGILAIIFLVSFLIASLANMVVIHFLQQQYDFFRVYPLSYLKSILITFILLFIGVYSPFYKVYTSDISGLLSDSSAFSNFRVMDYFLYLFLLYMGFFAISFISGISLLYSFLYSLAFIVLILVLYIFFSFLLKILFSFLSRFLDTHKNFYSYDALRSTIKPGNVSFLIIFSSFLSFVSIFIFSVFSGSFISFLWNLTANSNDTFVINISKDYAEVTREFFQEEEIYEIVPLRIETINRKTLAEHLGTQEVSREFGREFSSLVRPLDELVIEWQVLSSGWVSVDEEFAKRLDIERGDILVFTSAWLEKELIVQNLRKAERNGANPFFYFTLFPSDFERFPKSYFVSYSSEKKDADIQFLYSQATQGTVSFIDTKQIIAIVLDVSEKILSIIYFCLTYIFIFSFLTFIVSISFLRTFKTQKMKLLYILWGKKRGLLWSVFFEYAYLIVLGLLLSLLLWSFVLFLISYFLDFFSIELLSYIQGIILLFILLVTKLIYLKFSKKSL